MIYQLMITLSTLTIICVGFYIFYSTNTLHTLLSFLALVLLVSVVLILLGSELFAILYTLIYIGVLMVFFMFTLMLTNMRLEAKKLYSPEWVYFVMGYFHFWFMFIFAEVGSNSTDHLEDLVQIRQSDLDEPWVDSLVSLFDIEHIGFTLYTQYGIFVFFVGLILLCTLVGCLTMIDILKQHDKYRLEAAIVNESLKKEEQKKPKDVRDADWNV